MTNSGKPAASDVLKSLGAAEILPREAVTDTSSKPLLKPRWAAAVDTVGGTVLGTLLRAMQPRGCVAACGLVGGENLPATVYPFIIRGVTLAGIDSAQYPANLRDSIWRKLSSEWKPKLLDELTTEVSLDGLEEKIQQILKGEIVGRVVVKLPE